jgi:hypothetical protein
MTATFPSSRPMAIDLPPVPATTAQYGRFKQAFQTEVDIMMQYPHALMHADHDQS